MKFKLTSFFILLGISLAAVVNASILESLTRRCGLSLGLVSAPFKKPEGWFSRQFKTKENAEKWLYSQLPHSLSKTERGLLMTWPRQGYSLKMNKILCSEQPHARQDEVIIPTSDGGAFTFREITDNFEGIHARAKADQSLTAYRAISATDLAPETDLGSFIKDAGLMNLTLEESTAVIHGRNRARKGGGYILLAVKVPKGYPIAPTLSHDGRISVELEMTLPPNSRMLVKNKYKNKEGILVLEVELTTPR